jgi:protein-S-isoprenylcysteine O-methyltransferase Ste14
MDYGGPREATAVAIVADVALVGLFALQHSVMARPGFKSWWARVVPAPVERSTYVLAATACLLFLVWQWRPVGTMILWDSAGDPGGALLVGVSFLGWLIVLSSTFMLDHFELFGLRQVWRAFGERDLPPARFSTPGFYKVVRHPIYFGFLIAFWSTPTMTLGHLAFALAMTAYILVAVRLEERDLVHSFGGAYRDYQRRVSMLLPWRR